MGASPAFDSAVGGSESLIHPKGDARLQETSLKDLAILAPWRLERPAQGPTPGLLDGEHIGHTLALGRLARIRRHPRLVRVMPCQVTLALVGVCPPRRGAGLQGGDDAAVRTSARRLRPTGWSSRRAYPLRTLAFAPLPLAQESTPACTRRAKALGGTMRTPWVTRIFSDGTLQLYWGREVDIHHLGGALTETALDQPALFREGNWGLMTA